MNLFAQKFNKYKSFINKNAIKKSILPLSAFALFVTTVTCLNNQNYGLALEYKGQTVATVASEKVYNEANDMIIDQLSSSDKAKAKAKEAKAQVKLAPVSKEQCCESPDEVKNKIIEKSQDVITEAYGIYVNEKLIATVENESEANDIVTEILNQNKPDSAEFEVEFAEKVEIKKGIFAPEDITTKDNAKDIFEKGIQKFTEYTVLENDTVTGIAEKFGITVKDIQASNDICGDAVCVGDKLIIKTTDKVLHVKIFKVISEEREVPFSIEKIEDATKETSYNNVVQEGKNGKDFFKYKVEYDANGTEISRKELEHTVIEPSVVQKVIVGTKKPSSKSKFLWPVSFTHKITSPFGMRDGVLHKGIDIACAGILGKDIVASESGTVICAKCSGTGYGNHIIIDHGNGKQTVYAHCQSLKVSHGAKVSKGDVIATVGSTGNSTGPHLHFEIRINYEAKNPSQYV